jgi:hypothetical protein
MVAIVVCECQAGGCSGWNIDESALRSWPGLSVLLRDGTRGWSGVRGGGTLLGCEAARGLRFCSFGGGAGVCGWSPLIMGACVAVVVGVGLFLENCIVDASIL